ncbi:thiol:disulfide interchange protein DsbG [Marinobacter arenosus]|uniref:thiol:disulfide interchange protein DsbG n=1 Tax=Marinobacter arenosus TaxID=2856822 RepID=UPI001C4A940B|nr:thiol:disulfide interchange protein DsbG [Marinobacter arenosus]MBW0146160.1 thiol:disulfide interchange protein DsbG [Marinobacter arenosus]
MIGNTLKVILFFLPGLAFGQYPDAVQVLVDEGLTIDAQFEAPGGLAGFVGRSNGRAVTLYLMPDGEHVVVGTMMDGFGQDLSQAQIRAWAPRIDLNGVWSRLEKATWVAEGPAEAERIVYVFTDPNCGYCVVFREKAQPFLERGIELRHILVGVIQPSSLAKSASVIASPEPVEMLDFHDGQFPRDWLVTPASVPEELKTRVERNNRLMETLSVSATPAVFYKNAEGDVQRIVGLPDDSALAEAVFRTVDQTGEL